MSFLRSLVAVAALWLVCGCEIKRVLIVRPDGSGQITDHYLAPSDALRKERKPDEPEQGLTLSLVRPTASSLEENAAKYGEGVKLTSFKLIETKETLGYDAVYDFPDVNKLLVHAFLQQVEGPGEAVAPEGGPRNFEFKKGAVSELVIPMKGMQGKKEDSAPSAPEADSDPKQREGFFEAIKHLDLRMAIRVVGKIEETNAQFRDGNEIVLQEMNIKGMAADPKHVQEFKDAAAGKTSPKEPPEDSRYIKNEEAEVVKIRFK